MEKREIGDEVKEEEFVSASRGACEEDDECP